MDQTRQLRRGREALGYLTKRARGSLSPPSGKAVARARRAFMQLGDWEGCRSSARLDRVRRDRASRRPSRPWHPCERLSLTLRPRDPLQHDCLYHLRQCALPIRTRACLRLLSYERGRGREELARARAFTQQCAYLSCARA